MKNQIHPNSIIEEGAEIGVGNIISENVIIRKDIKIGNGNLFGPNTHISNNVIIGNDNIFFGFISIGSIAEMGSKGDFCIEDGHILIGSNNTFREFITINLPARKDKTSIGDNNYFMARTHIPHDAEIGCNVVFATNSLIGGGCVISNYVYIGLNAHVHQWVNIGEGAMLGMNSATTINVPPFMTVVGIPSKVIKINLEGLKRRNIDNQDIEVFQEYLQNQNLLMLESSNYLINRYIKFITNNNKFLQI